ncbi:MAG: hypothetical protein RJB11_1125, partial [Planctomycetota bacterium]
MIGVDFGSPWIDLYTGQRCCLGNFSLKPESADCENETFHLLDPQS